MKPIFAVIDFTLNDGIEMANFFVDMTEIVWVILGIGAVWRIVEANVNDWKDKKSMIGEDE